MASWGMGKRCGGSISYAGSYIRQFIWIYGGAGGGYGYGSSTGGGSCVLRHILLWCSVLDIRIALFPILDPDPGSNFVHNIYTYNNLIQAYDL